MAYAAAQLCSMLFRSGILAAVFGLTLGGALCSWTFLMRSLYLNLLWTAAPITLALLLATRLRTADWILHRNSLRAWLLPAGVLLVPCTAVLIAVPLMRIHNIPLVEPVLLAGEYQREPTAEEQTTEAMYQQARDVYAPWPRIAAAHRDQHEARAQSEIAPDPKAVAAQEEAWVQANQKTIERLVAAARRPLVDVRCPRDCPTRLNHGPIFIRSRISCRPRRTWPSARRSSTRRRSITWQPFGLLGAEDFTPRLPSLANGESSPYTMICGTGRCCRVRRPSASALCSSSSAS
jgi:hypothetical protein